MHMQRHPRAPITPTNDTSHDPPNLPEIHEGNWCARSPSLIGVMAGRGRHMGRGHWLPTFDGLVMCAGGEPVEFLMSLPNGAMFVPAS